MKYNFALWKSVLSLRWLFLCSNEFLRFIMKLWYFYSLPLFEFPILFRISEKSNDISKKKMQWFQFSKFSNFGDFWKKGYSWVSMVKFPYPQIFKIFMKHCWESLNKILDPKKSPPRTTSVSTPRFFSLIFFISFGKEIIFIILRGYRIFLSKNKFFRNSGQEGMGGVNFGPKIYLRYTEQCFMKILKIWDPSTSSRDFFVKFYSY